MGRASAWRPQWPFDYLWRPSNATLGPWTASDFATALSRLPDSRARAGLIYMQINPWAPWAELLAHSAMDQMLELSLRTRSTKDTQEYISFPMEK